VSGGIDAPTSATGLSDASSLPRLKGLPPPDPDFAFKDTSLMRALLNWSPPPAQHRGVGGGAGGVPLLSPSAASAVIDTRAVDNFLTLLSTCHTVLPDFPACHIDHIHFHEQCRHPVVYQASSPDEKALVLAGKNQGYYFFHREPAQIPMGAGQHGGMVTHPSPIAHQLSSSSSNAATRSTNQTEQLSLPLVRDQNPFQRPPSATGGPLHHPPHPPQNPQHTPHGHPAPHSTPAIASTPASSLSIQTPPPLSISPGGTININGEKIYVNILGTVHNFFLLDSFEFSSERARMSVILLDPRDGGIKLFCKGSDTKMFKLISAQSKTDNWAACERSLQNFSRFGLRTLVCGMKNLTEAEYVTWAQQYSAARSAISGREELVAQAQNAIEQNLTLLGATAIEDRLQDGVPESISKLSEAGIKIWVLTGDKVETAINIARSCHLVTPLHDRTGLLELIIDDKLGDEEALHATQTQLIQAQKRAHELAPTLAPGESDPRLAIIVSGQALSHIFSVVRDAKGREILYENLSSTQRKSADKLRAQFLDICSRCSAVVCCRVSPNQKAEVVSLVKNAFPDLVTLAIGDGANDVSMIKAAHVGIGISGLEGLQALMASDYRSVHDGSCIWKARPLAPPAIADFCASPLLCVQHCPIPLPRPSPARPRPLVVRTHQQVDPVFLLQECHHRIDLHLVRDEFWFLGTVIL
jgi:magnesium-transporting ATPase (P-type)